EFPAIGELPYMITLGPHGFYWFSLQKGRREDEQAWHAIGTVTVRGSWESAVAPSKSSNLTKALQSYLPTLRWYRDKTRTIKTLAIDDAIGLSRDLYLMILLVEFTSGEPSRYCLPVAFCPGEDEPEHALVLVKHKGPTGYLVDASTDPALADALLNITARNKTMRGRKTEIV